MTEKIMSPEEFFSGGSPETPASAPGSQAGIVSPEEFFAGSQPAALTVPVVSDEHRIPFIQKLGDTIYDQFLNTSLRVTGGIVGGVAAVNQAVGLFGANAIPGYQKYMVEPGKVAAQQAIEASQPDNFFERTYYETLTALSSLAPTLPVDAMTGGMTRSALVGRILPKMEAILGGIPDFALGMGWRGMVDGIAQSENVVEGAVKGVIGAGENMALGSLYASAGIGLKGIGKMAAIGGASAVYEAAKEGRPPTSDEILDGFSQGAAIGMVFTALPAIVEGTQNAKEKVVLQEYRTQIEKLIESPSAKEGMWLEPLLERQGEEAPKLTRLETPQTKPAPVFVLPSELSKSAPRYGYKQGNYKVTFDSDYDRAAYIVAANTKSAKHDSFVRWFGKQGVSETAAKEHGLKVRAALKAEAGALYNTEGSLSGVIRLPSMTPQKFQGKPLEVSPVPGGTTPVPIEPIRVPKSIDEANDISLDILNRFGATAIEATTMIKGKPVRYFKPPNKPQGYSPESAPQLVKALIQDERIRPQVREALAQPFLDLLDQRGKLVVPALKTGTWKDGGALRMLRETLERNLEGIAKGDAAAVKAFSTERVKDNETYRAKWETGYRGMLRTKLQEWNIKPNSIEDKLIQRYGEKRITLNELRRDHPETWQNIERAATWFREQYDYLLDTINAIRSRYDYDPIPKRSDYFRHFQELDTLSNVFGLTLGSKKVPTNIAGIVRKPKPGKPFSSVELERLGGTFTESAIGGFDNYIRAASKQIFHTDSVQRLRMLDNYIRGQAETNEQIDLSNFLTNLRDYTDILAGQPSDFDRSFQRLIGRPMYGVLRWLDKRTAGNMIGGNISAALSNNIAFTQSIATTAKGPALKGLYTSLLTAFAKDKHILKIDNVESGLWTRRYPDQKIALNFWDKAADNAAAFFQAVDQFAVKAIIAGKYYENRGKGMDPESAMRAADDYTGRLVTDRSWGQLPVIMESKGLRVVTRFQTEVNNMMSFLVKDIPQQYHGNIAKIASALVQYSVYSTVFNTLFEEIAGRRPTIDLIYMLGTLMGATKSGRNRPFAERIYPATKEVISQLPFGNFFVEGGRFPITAGIPNLQEIAKSPDLRTTGTEFMKPVFYLAPPFGGGQLKKTLQGMVDYAKGVSETPSGEERYSIHKDISNFLRGFVFGRNAFPEAVRYWSSPKEERN